MDERVVWLQCGQRKAKQRTHCCEGFPNDMKPNQSSDQRRRERHLNLSYSKSFKHTP